MMISKGNLNVHSTARLVDLGAFQTNSVARATESRLPNYSSAHKYTAIITAERITL